MRKRRERKDNFTELEVVLPLVCDEEQSSTKYSPTYIIGPILLTCCKPNLKCGAPSANQGSLLDIKPEGDSSSDLATDKNLICR